MKRARVWDRKSLPGEWVVTAKLDGVRALLTRGRALSRNGKPLYNLSHAWDGRDRDVEVFLGDFKNTISALKTKREVPIYSSALYDLDPIDPRLVIETVTDPSVRDLDAFLAEARRLGYEGLVLRQGDDWIKIKADETHDVTITGFKPGTGRNARRLGALVTTRGSVSGFTDEEREDLWRRRRRLVGQCVEVKCQRLHASGKFRHARFVRLRPDKAETRHFLKRSS